MNETIKQIDMFGNEVDFGEVPTGIKQGGRPKYKRMQELHGELRGFQCKGCKHCVAYGYNRTYYKCDLWIISNSEATDIRLKDTACKKYEQEKRAER